jgi:hypothetical protein
VNAMLTDDDLTRLLGDAAGSFPVPAFEAPVQDARPAVWRRRTPQVGAAAAVVFVAAALVLGSGPGGGSPSELAKSSPRAPSTAFDRQQSAPESLTPGTATSGVMAVGGTALQAATSGDAARVVKTGSMSLVVDNGKVSTTVARLQTIVAGLRGYVSDSTSEESGDHPTASLTVRVPVASFETLINQVRGLRVKVVSSQTSGQDVTATYADNNAQIQSLEAARNRYLAILSGAKTIGETLTVQQRVDDVQGQIDRLKGQQRVLADQSDLGTVTFSVAERADQVLTTSPRSGWSKAWHDATHGFTSGVQAIVAGSGRALLVLLVGAVLLVMARGGWRLARRRLV